jgi:hypothetical protein
VSGASTKTAPKTRVREARVAVSEANLRKAATRLLPSMLVSTEMQYVQRELGATSTQEQLDASVLAVRKLPWSSIVLQE